MIPKGNEKKKDLLYRYNKLRASPWHSRRRWWERTHSCCETLQWVDHPYSWPQRRILAIFFSSETLAHPVELPLHRFREPKSCVEMWTAKLRSFTLFIQKKMIKKFQQMIYRERRHRISGSRRKRRLAMDHGDGGTGGARLCSTSKGCW